jgi:hypothetical protein
MKKLTAEETGWIDLQLKKYKRLFPEFCAEVYDHILSAIELKMNEGDDRDVKVIYQQVIDDDFNGYKGIQKNAIQHFVAYRKGLWDVFMAVVKSNRNTNLPVGLAVIAIACFLPMQRKLLNEIMMCISFVLAAIPMVYSRYLLGFKNVNKELKISTTFTLANYPIILLFNGLYVIVFNGIKFFIDEDFKPFNCHPIVAALLLVCILVYDISFVQFCNQEFRKKIAV